MPRLYGFRDMARQHLHEEEAAALAQAASRYLAGQRRPEIVSWMHSQGYRTTVGGQWSEHRLAMVLDHPGIAGLVENENGELVPGGGPCVIEPEVFFRIRELRAENRKERRDQEEYLFQGGLHHCGLCGRPLSAAPANSGSRGYRCAPDSRRNPGGCGRIRISADGLETFVAEHVLAELAKPEIRQHVAEVRDKLLEQARQLRQRIEQDVQRQADLGREFAQSTEMSMAAYRTADEELTRKIKEGRSQARLLEQVRFAPVGGVPDLVRWWNHAPLASRRGLVTLMLERIDVYPAAARGSRVVDSDRVALTWRGQQKAAEPSPPGDA